MTQELTSGRNTIEMILALGGSRWEAAQEAIRQAVRAGMIPTLNQMTVVGIVSLPGMMTGQVLAGESPVDAVRYQIVIMFLIATSSALGTVGAVLLTYRRLFPGATGFCVSACKSASEPQVLQPLAIESSSQMCGRDGSRLHSSLLRAMLNRCCAPF
jgi:hypothetical protein